MTRIELGARLYAVTAAWCLSLVWLATMTLACTSSHEERSTETGNPPVIDVTRVALVVTNDSAHIVGQAGAVSPGGVTVQATIVANGEVVREKSAADGSFDLLLGPSIDVVVELHAIVGEQQSQTIYVTRGGATVGSEDGDSLSCMDRTSLASQAIASVVSSADRSCESVDDCVAVPSKSLCSDSCGDAVVARSGADSIGTAVERVERDLCANFNDDGCTVVPQPCPASPSWPVGCVGGQCRRVNLDECRACLNQPVSWGLTDNLATNTLSGCGDFERTTMNGPSCAGELARCPSDGSPSAHELGETLADPEVEAALASGATLGSIAPGGFSTRVAAGERSFVIGACAAGQSCSIPAGVQRLRELLQRIADEIPCEPAACPPNARYVDDYCVRCGAGGGCAETAARCATVCTDSSQCASEAGLLCSPRGICEAWFCI